MKFQNPSLNFFFLTDGRTNERTSRNQYAPHFFKVGGITTVIFLVSENLGLLWYNKFLNLTLIKYKECYLTWLSPILAINMMSFKISSRMAVVPSFQGGLL